QFAETFNCDLVIANKRRSITQANTVEKIDILSDSPLEDKTIWIVDDMIDTGGSVYTLVKELKKRGVKHVNIAIIHPVLSGPAVQRLSKLHEEGFLEHFLCVDTIYIPEAMKKELPFMNVVSSARLAAEIIYRINIGSSITQFFCPEDPYSVLE
ncbi:MAG TPA: phosphoribosyltransferase family protein, partial [Candidatus Mcinerneyibacteriales bacterium]|nr:phosphoribosyltransferase family protein [Candidatus Mcinerneyibacteriales bacterium]